MSDHVHTTLNAADSKENTVDATLSNVAFGRTSLLDADVQMTLPARGIDLGLLLCHCCGRLNSLSHMQAQSSQLQSEPLRCQRCEAPLYQRKTASVERTLAFLIAASILYIPANLLPMTITESVLGHQQDTIMSGVIYFWQSGDYFVATVIFIASIFIPMLKLVILALLLMAVYLQQSQRIQLLPIHCAILYRVVEFIGRWSMIDVFVVALLAALIQIHSLATILAGAGAVAFGAVVVLTMCASLSFDPRIIWDNYAQAQQLKFSYSSTMSHAVQQNHATTDFHSPHSDQEK